MKRRFQKLVLPVILLACSTITSAQSLDPKLINGRWNLILETALRRSEAVVDLRVGENGSARMVILTPVAGEEGLFTGTLAGNKFQLKGEYDRGPVELDLVVEGDRVNGMMTGGLPAKIQGQRLPATPPEVPVKRYQLLYDVVWSGVDNYFYDRKLNGVDPALVRSRHLQAIKAARDDGELTVAIRRSLHELRASNTDFFLSTGKRLTSLSTDRVVWRELGPKVSYLALSDFTADDLREFDYQLDRAMDGVAKYPSLVLDLRGNRGENLEAALAALNFLLPEGRAIAYFATRQGMSQLGVSSIDQIDRQSLPSAFVDDIAGVGKFRGAGMYLAGGKCKWLYRGRIALLIDETCVGSCELFAAAMKEAGAATLIGRRTRGALLFTSSVNFNFMKMHLIKSEVKGWRIDLPIMDIRTARGMKIEGQGVVPDLAVEKDASGNQDLLTYALSWLTKK